MSAAPRPSFPPALTKNQTCTLYVHLPHSFFFEWALAPFVRSTTVIFCNQNKSTPKIDSDVDESLS